ncbi:MAG TPA: cell envelope integrity protein CreD, partial [Bryobacteraceae bacterium]|nr:cell envelope integrity protein CreD [Bryobacteraceae bacterium]
MTPSILVDQIAETSRSLGVKLIVVCALALFMALPAFFVTGLAADRTERAADVVRQISSYSGGQQTFLGPTLLIPYQIPTQAPAVQAIHGTYVVFPTVATADVQTATEERRRSLFRVPVFRSDIRLDASFDLTDVPAKVSKGLELDWSRAELVVGVTDVRGALADATLTADGKTSVLVPAQIRSDITLGGEPSGGIKLTLLGSQADAIARPAAKFNVTAALRFSGAQRIALLSYGKTTHLTARGDWPNPGFDGSFLPTRRTLTKSGFTAEWLVPFIARGVGAQGPIESIAGLQSTSLGTSFVEVADPYQSVSRSLKYVLLFTGLIFLSYFVFEVSSGKRVHPAQYVLVGIAQIIFYLLLLSLSERIGFDWGFLIAGGS